MISGMYSFLCAALPCVIFLLIQVVIRKKNCTKGHLVWSLIFFLYIWMVLDVTGIGTAAEMIQYQRAGENGLLMGEINMIPFQSIGITFILNIIMFMPLGFLLPLIWWEYRRLSRVILTAAGFSAMIELLQIFNLRTTDIDDLIANTAGAALGYFIWKRLCVFCRKIVKPKGVCTKEAVCYLALALAGTFLLYNPFLVMKLLI